MALTQATYVENGKVVGGVVPDASSAIGYKENVGGTCANPNGYTKGSYFMASNNGYMYEALTNIAHGAAFQIGTNCKQTNVSTELSEINQHLSKNTLGTEQNITSETSFTVPNDGYIICIAPSDNAEAGISIDNHVVCFASRVTGANIITVNMFVRKGMIVVPQHQGGGLVRYYPLN